MTGKVTIDRTHAPTAATNGIDVYYNPDFVDTLSDQELRGLVLHEALHKAYRQIWLWKHLPDKQVLNKAMDYVINLEIDRIHPDVKLPDGGLLDHKYAGMDTGQVYHLLMQNGDGGGNGNPLDEHDFDGAEAAGITPDDAERIITEAIRQGQIMANKVSGARSRLLDTLIEPKVDWRTVLREFMTDYCRGTDDTTWRRPNRRYLSQGLYMPSTISESCGRVVVGIDTSGSTFDTQQLTRFLSEFAEICRTVLPAAVDLLYWDCAVARHEIYMPDAYDRIAESTKPAGGGGTNPTCVIQHIKDNGIEPVAIVMLTDGYVSDWGTAWPAPVIWCIANNKGTTAPCGVTCHVDD